MAFNLLKPAAVWALALSAVSLNAVAGDLPDQSITPGAVNPSITPANMRQTICVRGFTKTIRPPAWFTNTLKKEQIRQYGYVDRNPQHYEEDHLIPLELGGAPDDARNLWSEPRLSTWSADRKDELEGELRKLVCAGRLPLSVAQQAIATNWIEAYRRYVR